MKKVISTILIIILLFYSSPVHAANTHSTQLVKASSQYWSITDGDFTGFPTGDWTLEFWWKPDTSTANVQVMGKWVGGGQASIDFIYVNSLEEFRVKISSDGSNEDTHTHSYSITDDVWVHLALTFDASGAQTEFFVNGVSQGTDTKTLTSIFDSNSPLTFFGTDDGDFDGRADDLRLWNDIRTQPEIDDNKSLELVGNEAGLVGYWQFNNDAGVDQTSNSNDLTNNNAATFVTDPAFVESTDTCTYSSGNFDVLGSDACYATLDIYVAGEFNLIGPGSYGCADGVQVSAEKFNFGTGATSFDIDCFAHH